MDPSLRKPRDFVKRGDNRLVIANQLERDAQLQ
jgi:hypothetical protein